MAQVYSDLQALFNTRQVNAWLKAVPATAYTLTQLVGLMSDPMVDADMFLAGNPEMASQEVAGLCGAAAFTTTIVAMGSATVLADWRFTRVELANMTLVDPATDHSAAFVIPWTIQGDAITGSHA